MPAGPNERVLLEFFTIANLAGINKLQKGILGLNATTIGIAGGLYALIEIGKAADENYKQQLEATDQLTQAYGTQGDTLEAHKKEIDAWLAKNGEYIKDQYDAQRAIALFVRAGNGQAQTMRLIDDALDMSAQKHIDLGDAAKTIELILSGNSKALREYGISTDDYNKIMKDDSIPLIERQDRLLKLLEEKIAKSKESTDKATKSENARTNAWRDFTEKVGPPLLEIENKLNEAAGTGLGIMSVYVDLLTNLSKLKFPDLIHLISIMGNPALLAGDIFRQLPGGGGGTSSKPKGIRGGGRAGGIQSFDDGGVVPGPEGSPQLAVVHGGETVTPPGNGMGGNHIHVHVDRGAFIDGPSIDRLANMILQRARYAPGR